MSEKIKVSELTIEGVVYVPKESTACKVVESNGDVSPFMIGKSYLIRTVTMMLLGKLIIITNNEFVLSDASWIADSGRFSDALKFGVGKLNEVEMFTNDVIIGRGGLIDATEWIHELPKSTK